MTIWRLEEAASRLDELVRRARREGPQRIITDGKGTVVVIASSSGTGEALVHAMADRRIRDLVFDHPKIKPAVRQAEMSGGSSAT